jgi:signal transduction histidine kinase
VVLAQVERAGRATVGAAESFGRAAEAPDIDDLQSQVLQAEKMASIGRLAAGVAHEINNPMGFIHANLCQMAEYVADLRRMWNAVEGLQKAVAQGDAREIAAASGALGRASDELDCAFVISDLAKAVRESLEGSERIRHIVQDLREFSHHETGKRVRTDLNQCLESTTKIVHPMMKHLVSLERDYGELPGLTCFPMQLKQVFINLLVNAFQSIETRVGESGGSGTIWVRTHASEEGISISVQDDGVGIPEDSLERVFEPFFTTKKVGAGTGLGLSTSYSIVRRHGGTLRAESGPGEGAALCIFLPFPEEDRLDRDG